MPGAWTWTDAWIFIVVFIGIRIAFIWLATKAFIAMIPEGDRCILCDGHTLPIERNGWWQVLGPSFRRSWCLDCGWEGVLRRSEVPPPPTGGRSGLSAKEYTHRSLDRRG